MVILNMMSGINGLWMGWHIHMLLGVVLTVGLVLFVIWAYKALKPNQLAMWALWLIIIGFAGILLTSTWGGKAWTSMMQGFRGFETVEDASSSQ